VGCEFCGIKYLFDPIDAAQIFLPKEGVVPPSSGVQ
jgi:molecular chaperone Hsp33